MINKNEGSEYLVKGEFVVSGNQSNTTYKLRINIRKSIIRKK